MSSKIKIRRKFVPPLYSVIKKIIAILDNDDNYGRGTLLDIIEIAKRVDESDQNDE
jgi:hypothetical protein